MSSSYGGALRQARAEIIPLMPELLPELIEDRQVILRAIKSTFAKSGRDLDEVTKADWNKAERYTISGHFIRQQAEILVEGTGSEARFTNFLHARSGKRTPANFKQSVRRTQTSGIKQITLNYRESEGRYGNSYTRAVARYRQLGAVAFFRDGIIRKAGSSQLAVKPGAAFEGVFLGKSMRGPALGGAVALHMNHIMPQIAPSLPKKERLQATHDLSHIPIGVAGIHLFDVLDQRFTMPDIAVAKDEQTGSYRATYADPTEARAMYSTRFTNIPTQRHKCPAHVRLPDPETGIRMDSPLQNMFHAAINASVEFGYYEL